MDSIQLRHEFGGNSDVDADRAHVDSLCSTAHHGNMGACVVPRILGDADHSDVDAGFSKCNVQPRAKARLARREPDVTIDDHRVDDDAAGGHGLEHLQHAGQLALVEGTGFVVGDISDDDGDFKVGDIRSDGDEADGSSDSEAIAIVDIDSNNHSALLCVVANSTRALALASSIC